MCPWYTIVHFMCPFSDLVLILGAWSQPFVCVSTSISILSMSSSLFVWFPCLFSIFMFIVIYTFGGKFTFNAWVFNRVNMWHVCVSSFNICVSVFTLIFSSGLLLAFNPLCPCSFSSWMCLCSFSYVFIFILCVSVQLYFLCVRVDIQLFGSPFTCFTCFIFNLWCAW
jgi:hypothetical protein